MSPKLDTIGGNSEMNLETQVLNTYLSAAVLGSCSNDIPVHCLMLSVDILVGLPLPPPPSSPICSSLQDGFCQAI